MAAECTQEAVLDFLKDRGGKVRSADLVEHFRVAFPEDPGQRTEVRRAFKTHVDNVAFVKTESGVKYVHLKKKFRGPEPGQDAEPGQEALGPRGCPPAAGCRADDAAEEPVRQHAPGSGYNQVPHVSSPAAILQDSRSGEMGNRGSVRRESTRGSRRESSWGSNRGSNRGSTRGSRDGNVPDIPEITVIQASPLPAEESVFNLPGPVQTGPGLQTGPGPVQTGPGLQTGPGPADRPVEGLKEAEVYAVTLHSSDGVEDHLDAHSLSGSEGPSSPRGSREHFLEVMMSSSPQVRRSVAFRGSVYLPSRSDTDSLASSNPDDDGTSVALDPLEHEWMMCASDGEWSSLAGLLATEPGLVLRKDFVTGFTCLHWAAKQGKPELIALIINFAKQHNVPVSVDVRSNTGYTPLHVAAMHNHMEVVKLLVGAYGADVEVRDYSGRKACQYLTDNVSVDIQDIIGAYERSDATNAAASGDGARWRFSKVLQTNLKPLRLLSANDCDGVEGEAPPRAKPLRRKSSLSRMKPKLQRLRVRTSQILHSTSFHDAEELDGAEKKPRPKTHFFGSGPPYTSSQLSFSL